MNIDMIKFDIMGKIIVPPLKFIMILILCTVIFLIFVLIYNWGQWISIFPDLKNSLLLFIPAAAGDIILPSVSAALLFTFFGFRRSSIHPAAAMIICAAAFAVIFFSFGFASGMEINNDEISFQPFNSRKLHTAADGIIYTDKVDGDGSGRLHGILIRHSGSEAPAFQYFPEGRAVTDGETAIEIGRAGKLKIEPGNPVFHSTFEPEPVLGLYYSDIGFLNNSLKEAARSGGSQYLIFTAVITLFLTTSMLFRGASAWPLLDIILILTFHRLIFYLFRLFTTEAGFITETLFGGNAPADIALMTMAAATALLLLSGLLLKLTGRRKKP